MKTDAEVEAEADAEAEHLKLQVGSWKLKAKVVARGTENKQRESQAEAKGNGCIVVCVCGRWANGAMGRGGSCNLNFACMKNAAHLLNARDVPCCVVSEEWIESGGVSEERGGELIQDELGNQLTSKMNATHTASPLVPSSSPTQPSPAPVWLAVCLFACADVMLSMLF